MYIHALVTIVFERAWAALKCDQLPVPRAVFPGGFYVLNHIDTVKPHYEDHLLKSGLISDVVLISNTIS